MSLLFFLLEKILNVFFFLEKERFAKFGSVIFKTNKYNSLDNKSKAQTNSEKIFIIGPSMVRSFSSNEYFIPLFCRPGLHSTFLENKFKKTTKDYISVLNKIDQKSKIVMAMGTQDPDIILRKNIKNYTGDLDDGYKKIDNEVKKKLNIAAKKNFYLTNYSVKKRKHDLIYLLGWPHLNLEVSKAIKYYNACLKRLFQKNNIKYIDISNSLKNKTGSLSQKWSISKENFHLKKKATKILHKELQKKKFIKDNYKYYKWKNILKLKFKNTKDITISSIPFKGTVNLFDNLVQKSFIENYMKKFLVGYAATNNTKKIILINSGEGNIGIDFPPFFFKKIILINDKKTNQFAKAIINLANRNDIYPLDYNDLIAEKSKLIVYVFFDNNDAKILDFLNKVLTTLNIKKIFFVCKKENLFYFNKKLKTKLKLIKKFDESILNKNMKGFCLFSN